MVKRRIQIGDQFIRHDSPRNVWVVEKIFDYPDIPSHARLRELASNRLATFSVTALCSSGQFRPIQKMDDVEACCRSHRNIKAE